MLQLVTPIKSMTLVAREVEHDTRRSVHNYELSLTSDGATHRGEFVISGVERTINLKAFHDEGII